MATLQPYLLLGVRQNEFQVSHRWRSSYDQYDVRLGLFSWLPSRIVLRAEWLEDLFTKSFLKLFKFLPLYCLTGFHLRGPYPMQVLCTKVRNLSCLNAISS